MVCGLPEALRKSFSFCANKLDYSITCLYQQAGKQSEGAPGVEIEKGDTTTEIVREREGAREELRR